MAESAGLLKHQGHASRGTRGCLRVVGADGAKGAWFRSWLLPGTAQRAYPYSIRAAYVCVQRGDGSGVLNAAPPAPRASNCNKRRVHRRRGWSCLRARAADSAPSALPPAAHEQEGDANPLSLRQEGAHCKKVTRLLMLHTGRAQHDAAQRAGSHPTGFRDLTGAEPTQ